MWYTSLTVVRQHRLLSQGLTLLALILAVALLTMLETRVASLPAHQATLALIVAIGQWQWTLQRVLTSALVLWPLCLYLIALLFLACAPQDWLSPEHLCEQLHWLTAPSSCLDWRPPLVELVVLTLLALGILARTRSSLGVPLLHLSCCLILLVDQTPLQRLLPAAMLHHDPSPGVTAVLGLLLAGQWVGVVSGWRPTRDSLRRGLWPSTLLVVTTLALWQYLEVKADNVLQHLGKREGLAMEERLASEFSDVLHSLQQLQVFLAQASPPPDAGHWQQLTEPLEQHFPYLTSLDLKRHQDTGPAVGQGFGPDHRSGIISGVNDAFGSGHDSGLASEPGTTRAHHTDVPPAQVSVAPRPAGTPSPAQMAILLTFPLSHPADRPLGRPVDRLTATLSLSAMSADMVQPEQADRGSFQVRLSHHEHLIREWPMRGHPSPWSVSLPLEAIPLGTLSDTTANSDARYLALQLTLCPDTRLLQRLHSRLPAVTLVLGLLFSQFLYLTLFSQHQMASQHRAITRSNRDLRREVRTRHRLQQQLSWLADHDELTGLPNRRHLQATAQTWRERLPLSVILIDIDHFKRINDCLGHAEGDRVLKTVARLSKDILGQDGLLGRYGGEEFLAIVPEGQLADACAVAERLRRGIRHAALAHHDGTPLTISLGVASQNHPPLDLPSLIQKADQALYLAKHQGRNRVASFDDIADSAPPVDTPSFTA